MTGQTENSLISGMRAQSAKNNAEMMRKEGGDGRPAFDSVGNSPEEYRTQFWLATSLLDENGPSYSVEKAQVHATLAVAIATRMQTER